MKLHAQFVSANLPMLLGQLGQVGPKTGIGGGRQQIRPHPASRGRDPRYSQRVVSKRRICESQVFGSPQGPFQYQGHVDNNHSEDKRVMKNRTYF